MIEWKTENPNHTATPCTLHEDCDHIYYSTVTYFGYDGGTLLGAYGYDRTHIGKLQLISGKKISAIIPVRLAVVSCFDKPYTLEEYDQIAHQQLRETLEEIYTGDVIDNGSYYKQHPSYKQGLIERKESILETCKYDFTAPTFN